MVFGAQHDGIAKQSGLLRPGILPSLQFAFFCGEALPTSSALAWMAAAPDALVANLYGPTEATIAITAYTLARDDSAWQQRSVVPIGRPYPGQRACVINEQGQCAAPGETGELWLAGDQLTAGYLADPDKTAAVFVEHEPLPGGPRRWYRTGDCACSIRWWDFATWAVLTVRSKINGYRVELQEVEHRLRQVAGTELVAVLPPSAKRRWTLHRHCRLCGGAGASA
ncbi:MAG: AMP-binding protein [Gammaproteobacteria bacterium]